MNRRDFHSQYVFVGFGRHVEQRQLGPRRSAFPVVRTPKESGNSRARPSNAPSRRSSRTSATRNLPGCSRTVFRTRSTRRSISPMIDGQPDTYVITGDIDAMWQRDSTAQVWPYLPLAKDDPALRQLIAGVINRQTKNILLDPYANAFYKDAVEAERVAQRPDRDEARRPRAQMGDRFALLSAPAGLRILEANRRRLAVRRRVAQSGLARAANVPRTAAEERPRAVPLPARDRHADRHRGLRRLRPAGQAGGADPFDVPPQRRLDDLSVSGAVEFLRRGRVAAGGGDAGKHPSRRRNRRASAARWPTKSKRRLREYAIVDHPQAGRSMPSRSTPTGTTTASTTPTFRTCFRCPISGPSSSTIRSIKRRGGWCFPI